MKKNNPFLNLGLASVMVVVAGCGNTVNKSSESIHSETTSSEAVSSMPTEKAEIVYRAVVKEDRTSETGQIWVEKLTPVDSRNETPAMFEEEVILLTDGSNVVSEGNEKISLDELKVGSELEVTLAAEPVSTMSIPPQIPGDSVHKVVLK